MKTAKKIKDTFDTFELFDINSLGKKKTWVKAIILLKLIRMSLKRKNQSFQKTQSRNIF